MVEFKIDNKDNNKKIHTVLLNHFNGLSSSLIFKTLKAKDIKVNGKRINNNISVFKGDIINFYIDDKYLYKEILLDIIYEDNNIVVVNKPKSIEVINETNYNLTIQLQNHYKDLDKEFPFPCHRLDRNTSGLVVFAKNKQILDIINEKFLNYEISKFYKCTVIGILNKKENTLEDYLFKDSKKSMVYISSVPKQGYRKIITSYKVISEDIKNNLSILEVQLHTGRTHQIRAHLAHICHPILR